MSEELTNQMNDQQPEQWYPVRRFYTLLILLLVLFSLFTIGQHLMPEPESDQPAFSEEILQGDMYLKLSYVPVKWMSSAVRGAGNASSFQESQRTAALIWYDQAVQEDPSPAALRRIIIAGRLDARKSAIMLITAQGLTPGVGLHEAAMWRDIYLSTEPIPDKRVSEYSEIIRGLSLGWVENVAAADLYTRVGMKAEATKAHNKAAELARVSTMRLGILMFALILLGLAGFVLIVWFVVARLTGYIRPVALDMPISPAQRSMLAGGLLEVFVVYIVATIAFQAVAALVLIALPANRAGDMAVLSTVVVYVAAGVVALQYLILRLRRAGWTMSMVGFGTQGVWADIAWGIGGYAACLPLIVIAAWISRSFSKLVKTPSNPILPMFMESSTNLERVMLLLLAAVAAPIFEEIFFRGALFHSFRAKWGARVGVAASAVGFALVHPLPLDFLPILVLGSVFGIIVHQRGSLLPSMIAHAMNNTVAFMLLLVLTGL